jgi:hypothetical protein
LEGREEEMKMQNDLDAFALARRKVIASSHESNQIQRRAELIGQTEREKQKDRNDLVEETSDTSTFALSFFNLLLGESFTILY